MKKIIFGMLLSVAGFATQPAVDVHQLKATRAEGTLFRAHNTIASLIVNYQAKTLTLTVQPGFYCPPGRVCAQVMPRPKTFVAPFKSVEALPNGKRIVAKIDQRPVDGNMT